MFSVNCHNGKPSAGTLGAIYTHVMKKTIFTIIAFVFLIFYSCQKNSSNYKIFELGEFKIQMTEPNDFRNATKEEVTEFERNGNSSLRSYGVENTAPQKTIFFLKKDEFSFLKGVSFNLSNSEIENYHKDLKRMEKISFSALQKTMDSEMSLDSLSRIQEINGTKFYVFETKVTFLDSVGQKFNLKSIKYNTLLGKTNFMVDGGFINEKDGEEILNSIKSINIKN